MGVWMWSGDSADHDLLFCSQSFEALVSQITGQCGLGNERSARWTSLLDARQITALIDVCLQQVVCR